MALLTTLHPEDEALLARAYALEAPVFEPLPDRGTVNSNVRIRAGDRTLFLRVNEGKRVEQVAAEAALVGYLARHGVPTPEPIHTVSGAPFVLVQGKPATLFPWLPGSDADERHPDAAWQVGTLLAELHLAGAGYPVERLPPNAYDLDALTDRVERIAATDAYADVVGIARHELGAARRRSRGETGLVHQDLFPDNVLVDKAGRFVAVLDFEQACAGPLAYDLAVVLHAWCWRGAAFDAAAVEALVGAYDRVRPRDAVERAALSGELGLAAVRFAITRVTDIELQPSIPAELRARKDYRDYLRRHAALSELRALPSLQ